MLTATPCVRRFARVPEGPVALLQVCDLRDAGIAAALRLPPRAAPCDARTGEPSASQAGAGEVLDLLATLNINRSSLFAADLTAGTTKSCTAQHST